MGSRRICLRLQGDSHGRETALHEWRGAGAGPRIWRTTSNDGWSSPPPVDGKGPYKGRRENCEQQASHQPASHSLQPGRSAHLPGRTATGGLTTRTLPTYSHPSRILGEV